MEKPNIGFIGLGSMGTGMCRRLLESGYTVSAFNRTASKAESLKNLGLVLETTPERVAERSDILITMVSDDQALEEVIFANDGALKGLKPSGIHISMSTISERLAEKLTEKHRETKTHHVGAPVFGRPPAAAAGKLFILAAGPLDVVEQCKDIFAVLGQKQIIIGAQPKEAHLTKILGNFMLFSALETMAESISHAKRSGLNERKFLEAMTQTIFTAPIYQNYGTMMVDQNFPTSNAVDFKLAIKDIRLALDSSNQQKTEMPVAALIEKRLQHGIENGYEKFDVSALVDLAAGLKK